MVFLLIINCLLLEIFIKNNINTNCKEVKTDTSTKSEIKPWEANVKDYDNFVFLGDSITEQYPIEEMYGLNIPIINSGISGFKTTDILKEMDNLVYKYNPSKVFILIGTNDLRYSDDEEDEDEIIKNIEEIVESIQDKRPKAKIYVQSIYPVNKNMKINNTQERNNEEIKYVNAEVEKYCKKNNITYIDMFDLLTDGNGDFEERYSKDGLHVSTLGYIVITKKLMEYMN